MKAETALKGSPKKRETWSKTVEKNGITSRTSVEKLDNEGYLVSINVYGETKKGVYKDIIKKLYSLTNPLEEVEEPLDSLFNSIK